MTDPKHRALIVKEFFKDNNINMLERAQSPDLNLIENLWSHLKRKFRERKPSNLEELEVIAK